MEKDRRVLDYLSKNQNVSQREIAQYAGLSLGNVNLIIRKMVVKGFIKIERLNPNTLLYILTPQGFEEKAKKTYRYIRDSMSKVLELKQELIQIMNQFASNDYDVYIYGEEDEIKEILRQLTGDKTLCRLQWLEDIEELLEQDKKPLVLIWQGDKEKEMQGINIDYINLLNRVDY